MTIRDVLLFHQHQRKFINHSLLSMNCVTPGVRHGWARNVFILFSVKMEFDVIWIDNAHVAVAKDKWINVY